MRNDLITCACAFAFAVAFTPEVAHAQHATPPPVPSGIVLPAGNFRAFLVGHAVGTQNYICLPTATGFAWVFFGPQATLFADDGRQIATHYLSPNPEEADTLRPTWQDSLDTSAVWGQSIASAPVANAIPWLLLRVVGAEEGLIGRDRLTGADYIHRLNTAGGVAPSTGCAVAGDVGGRQFVPYTADYYFYRNTAEQR